MKLGVLLEGRSWQRAWMRIQQVLVMLNLTIFMLTAR